MNFQKDIEKNENRFLTRLVEFTDRHVLEVGCGEGRLTWMYAKQARQVTGIDPDRDALRVARYDIPSGLRQTTSLACASSLNLPFPRETFDMALLSWSL